MAAIHQGMHLAPAKVIAGQLSNVRHVHVQRRSGVFEGTAPIRVQPRDPLARGPRAHYDKVCLRELQAPRAYIFVIEVTSS